MKRTRVTLEIMWDDCIDGSWQAPPEKWDWATLLDMPDSEDVQVVGEDKAEQVLAIVGKATAQHKHEQRKVYGDDSLQVSHVAQMRCEITNALQAADIDVMPFYNFEKVVGGITL
jgi:hypothetical protein